MPFMNQKKAPIYFEAHGSGPALLLVSGLGGGTWSWFGQVPYFAARYRVITMDNRGAGRSGELTTSHTMTDFAIDVLELLNHLGVEKVHVLGLSMGGMIAQELALAAPHRVKALVLGCTHCGGGSKISPTPQVVQTLINNKGLSRREIVRKNLPLFFSRSFLHDHPDEVERYHEAQVGAPTQPEQSFQLQLKAIADFDCCPRLPLIQAPTLIVTGVEDVLIPPANSHILHEHLPQSDLVEIDGAGHALHVECRDRLNDLASSFFNRYN